MQLVEQDEYVSVKEVASVLGITEQRVQQLTRQGLPKGDRNQYPLLGCIKFYISYLQQQLDQNANDNIVKEKIKLYRARAEKAEAESEKLRGRLLDVADATQQVMAIMQELKDNLLGISGRFCHEVVKLAPAQVKELIEIEITKSLSEVAKNLDAKCLTKSSSGRTENQALQNGGGLGSPESDTATRDSGAGPL